MKKNMLSSFLLVTVLFCSCKKQSQDSIQGPAGIKTSFAMKTLSSGDSTSLLGWNLIFNDEFSTGSTFDNTKWGYCPRATSDWAKYLTSSISYVNVSNNNLQLNMDNAVISGDTAKYHSGGIQSSGKFSFTYGKIQVRAKFTQGQGSWPAIWMLPQTSTYGGWPNSGEIDLMEHLNNDNIVYLTLHGQSLSSGSAYTTGFTANQYNTYGIEWFPNALTFYVNNTIVGTYSRSASGGSAQWPFSIPFYLILNQSGGGSWGGPITNSALPFNMGVDYVRVYQPDTSVVSGGVYNISTSLNNTSSLDLYNGVAQNGTNVILYQKTGGTNQEWTFTSLGNGYYKIIPVNGTSLALSVPGNVSTSGTQLQLNTYTGATGQEWKITNLGNGLFGLLPACATSSNMEVSGASITNGTKIVINPSSSVIDQQFILRRVQ